MVIDRCKVFTPRDYVLDLLNKANYKNNLFGKKVLENSCGEGNILVEIVRRYILSCKKQRMGIDEIKNGLEQDVIGVEIDEDCIIQCKKNLDKVAIKFGIVNVKWNIIQANYLHLDLSEKFSYILGNPPYIMYREISEDEKIFIRKNYATCDKGKFDYYYAFIEKSLRELEDDGKLAYIIPNSIYKNVYANKLRELIKPYIKAIYDYTVQKKFPGITISSNIVVLCKNDESSFSYTDVLKGEKRNIRKNELGEKWMFDSAKGKDYQKRFGDYFKVNNTIATLYNEAFILDGFIEKEDYYIKNDIMIEKKNVYTAYSRKHKNKQLKIIFPYSVENNEVIKYSQDDFEQEFPLTCAYLKKYNNKLKARKVENNTKWFEYGRSQSIRYMPLSKISIPSVLSGKIEATILDGCIIPCAGFIILPKSDHSLDEAKLILESQEFYDYLNNIGVTTTGKSKRLTVYDIQNYCFNNWL